MLSSFLWMVEQSRRVFNRLLQPWSSENILCAKVIARSDIGGTCVNLKVEKMETLPIEGDVFGKIVLALRRSTLFSSLDDKLLSQMAGACHLLKFADQEVMVTEGEPSDSFYMILSGQAAVMAKHHITGDQIEQARLGSSDGIGEMGLLMEQPRSATVVTTQQTLALKLEKKLFDALFDRTSGLPGRFAGP